MASLFELRDSGRPILGPILGLLYGPILDLPIFGPILSLILDWSILMSSKLYFLVYQTEPFWIIQRSIFLDMDNPKQFLKRIKSDR